MVLSTHKQIKETLSHPMLLLIVGAIISSLIIPYFTRQWQDHQKELELISDLSDQINKVVSDALTISDLINNPFYDRNQDVNQKYVSTYEDFQTAKSMNQRSRFTFLIINLQRIGII
jgi:hypothetical protein